MVSVETNITTVGIPEGWEVSTSWSEAELESAETTTNPLVNTTTLAAPKELLHDGYTGPQGAKMALPGDEQLVAVKAFVGEALIGGIQVDIAPSQQYIYLPLILKKVTKT